MNPTATATTEEPAGDATAELSCALQEKFGLPELHAEMFALAAVCAATGIVRGVRDPAGGILSPTLQIVAHGKAQVTLQSALRGALNPVSEVQGARFRNAMLKGEADARDQIKRLQSKIEKARELIAEADEQLNPVSNFSGRALADAESMLKFNQAANPELLKHRTAAQAKLTEMENELHRLTIVKSPIMVIHSVLPAEINAMRRDSLDGILFNLDERGISLNQLLSANQQRRREICHATAVALGHQVVRPDNPRLVPLGNSAASVVTGYQAAKLMRNKEVRASGLLDLVVFLKLDETTAREGPADMAGEESIAGRLAQRLMMLRAENKSKVLELSNAAREMYWTMRRQVERVAMDEPEEFLPRLSVLPLQALKFAVLYHIGAGGLDVPEISAATFEKARDLAWRIFEHQKCALQVPGDEALSDRCFDLDVLKLVVKIKGMENPTRRDIIRSCHDQDYEWLGALLLKAEADGWIRETEGRYVALSPVSVAA